MIELLVHFKLGVNFETKTRLAGEWVCSCPKQVLNFMPLLPVIKTDSADSYIASTLAASVGKHQSTTDSIAFKNATWFQATHKGSKGGVLWGQEMPNSDTASRQPVFNGFLNNPQRVLDPVTIASRSEKTSVHRHPTARES